MPEVIVPWYGDCPHRLKALEYVKGRYANLGWPVTVAHGSARWVKAEATMPAVRASTADVLVIADADVWTDGLPEAVRAVELGAGWAKPHKLVHRLTAESTDRYIAGEPWEGLDLDRKSYVGIAGGGYVVAKRETLLDIPLDPRFVGWGQEDESWAVALHLLAGMAYLGRADLIHLWHPPQPRLTDRRGSEESWLLMRRYVNARRNPEAMRDLVAEIKETHDLEPHQPGVPDSAPRPVRG